MKDKVKQVLNEGKPVKTGQSARGKWAKFKVLTATGQTVYPFGPVDVGDELELWEDEQYGMQAKVLKPDKFEAILKRLDLIQATLDKLVLNDAALGLDGPEGPENGPDVDAEYDRLMEEGL